MNQKRIFDYGIRIGNGKRGKLNKISDVAGVTVGHSTIRNEAHNTGVTVVMPSKSNIFRAVWVLPANRGTNPTAVSTVKTPAADSRPKLTPPNIKKKYFIGLSFSPQHAFP